MSSRGDDRFQDMFPLEFYPTIVQTLFIKRFHGILKHWIARNTYLCARRFYLNDYNFGNVFSVGKLIIDSVGK